MMRNADMAKLFDEGASLVDFLPYGEYIDGLFLQVDGSVGKIWEIAPLETEAMEMLRLEASAQMLSGLAGCLPVGVQAQILTWSDGDVLPALSGYQSLKAESRQALPDAVIDGKLAHMMGSGIMFRRVRIFLALRHFPVWEEENGADLVRGYFTGEDGLHERFLKDWLGIRQAFSRTCAMVESQLQALGMLFEGVDGDRLRQLLYRWLNPARSRRIPVAHARRDLIRDQVLFNAPRVTGRGFIFEGFHTRVVSLRELPQATFPGMFCGDFLDIHPGMMLVIDFTVPDQQQALQRIKFQKAFAFIQRTSSGGDTSEEAVQKKAELSDLITQTFKSGKIIVQARMHVIFMGEDEEVLERASDALMARLHRYGADGIREEIIAPSLFLTCLPLNFDQRLEGVIRRERRLLSDNFADMMPFYGAWRGTATPAVIYVNRRGTPTGMDFFDSPTNPHGMIIGASGSGKSFLTNDFIYQNYRLGAHFFILDKGHSYRKTCAMLDGRYIHFDLRNPVTINPFAQALTDENAAFLLEVLALMASGGDERDRVTREEKGSLQMALAQACRCVSGREVTLSDVVDALCQGDGHRLALKLAPFTRQGPYGKFFDGQNQFVVDRRFTVFELADLGAYPELQLVVLLNIMFCVTRFVASDNMRGQRKFFMIDEAWQLLKMANTADFISSAFKTFRKCGCSAVAVTQEVTDLLQQPSGSAILANTANKIFLKQEPSVIERLRQELCLSREAADLLRSLETVKGRYAEALVMLPASTGVARLVPDPFLYWAATSEARDNAYLEDIRNKYDGDLAAALRHCAGAFPYGVR